MSKALETGALTGLRGAGVALRLLLQGLLVVHVLSQTGPHTLEVGDMVANLLDGLHLLLQVIPLQEVGHLCVVVVAGHRVEVEQRLVDALLQSQSHLHGVQACAPLVTVRLLDVLKDDASSPLVLELHELLSMLALLVRRMLEELGKAGQRHVITVEVEGHGLVAVRSVELHVDLPVHTGLALGMVVLAALGKSHLEFR
jgi:hypothetical protein